MYIDILCMSIQMSRPKHNKMLWSPETDADRYVDGTHIRKR